MNGRPIPCRVFQTGKLYPSYTAALRDLGVSLGNAATAKAGQPVGRQRWLIDPLDPSDPDWQRRPRCTRTGAGGHNARPVRCIETGQIFTSGAKAAASLHLSRNSIYQAIRRGYCAGGYRWEWADQ